MIAWYKQSPTGTAAATAREFARSSLGTLDGVVSFVAMGHDRSIRLVERLDALKDKSAPSIDGSDAVYRHPSPAQLPGSQLAHGIEMEIAHYQDPLFKPEGWAID